MLAWRTNAQSQVIMMNRIISPINTEVLFKNDLVPANRTEQAQQTVLFFLFKTRFNALYSLIEQVSVSSDWQLELNYIKQNGGRPRG